MADETNVILVKPTIDLSAWNASISAMLSDSARIESAFKGAFELSKVDFKIDDSALKTAQRTLDSLDAGVTSEVDFTMEDENVVKKTLDKLDSGTTAEVDFKATGDTEVKQILSDIETKLGTLNKLAIINLAMDIPATAEGFISTLTNLPGVSTLIEMDTALAQVEGRTGRMIPNAEELIIDLYTNAWGDSITAVGEVVTAASNLGIEMGSVEDAVKAAFNLEALGIGTAEENLRSLDTIVKNGLAPDFESASDILAAGLQTGANRGQDLLDTFNEYGSTFGQLGISGKAALAFINSGLKAGIDNSDRIADAIRETGIRLGEIHTDTNIQAAFDDLDALTDIDLAAMLTGWEAGDISGDEMFGAIFQAIEDASIADPAKAKTLAATLIGTIAEDFGTEAIGKLTPVWDESLWGPLENRAQTSADAVNNTLGTALTELFRTLETEFATTLDDTFDFDTVIDNAKQAIKDIAAAIRGGEGFAEALEIGLKIPGFSDDVHRIESAINNFLIGLLQAVADIGAFLGKDVSGIRGEVARVGAGQLQFDLEVATNEDEIAAAYSRAIDRGVDASVIGQRATEAALKLFDAGDIERAQQLIEVLQRPEVSLSGLSEGGREIVANAESLTEALDALYEWQTKAAEQGGKIGETIGAQVASDIATVEAAINQTTGLGAISGLVGVKEDVSGVQDTLATAAEGMKLTASDIGTTYENLSLNTNSAMTTMKDTSTLSTDTIVADGQRIVTQMWGTRDSVDDLGSAVATQIPQATEYMNAFLTGLADGSENAISFLVAVATQLGDMANSAQIIADASKSIGEGLGGNTPDGHASGGVFSGWGLVGERGPEAVFANEKMAVLNNATTDRLFTALGSSMFTGTSSVQNTTRNTVNAPIYVTNFAQGEAAAGRVVNAMRGF